MKPGPFDLFVFEVGNKYRVKRNWERISKIHCKNGFLNIALQISPKTQFPGNS